MDVILLERIEKLGRMGDVVTVKAGYARNFLLPRKKALRATEENKTLFEQQRDTLEAANEKARGEAMAVAGTIEDLSCVVIRQAGENGQLYGSVTARDIAAFVTEAGVAVRRGQVELDHPIKSIGLHQVRIALHPEISHTLTVNVARSEDEAERQARGENVLIERDEEDEPEVEPSPEPEDEAAAAEAGEAEEAPPA